MSYRISLFRIETKEKQRNSNDDNFFEKEGNIIPFTNQQFQELQQRLLLYDYELTMQDNNNLYFRHPDEDFGTALLTPKALYFTASLSENSIFEVGMTASEFTDTGEYAKYDFQNGVWEIPE
jgi:hypothetical protein